LGAPDGKLVIGWQVTTTSAKRRLMVEWRETGVAARRAPIDSDHVGVGRTLIEQSLPFQLDAETRLEIGRDIVRCILSIPLEETAGLR
jgi:two-component sensor histidine kinase